MILSKEVKEFLIKTSLTLYSIDKLIEFIRYQKYAAAMISLNEFIGAIGIFMEKFSGIAPAVGDKTNVSMGDFLPAMQNILECEQKKDYILLADYLELLIKPLLTQLEMDLHIGVEVEMNQELALINLNALTEKDESIQDVIHEIKILSQKEKFHYFVEFTSSGIVTMGYKDEIECYYLHSNVSPLTEAYSLAKEWFDMDKYQYVIYGLGLGYAADQLSELSKFITIEVYESDPQVILLAAACSERKAIFCNPNIKVIYDPDFQRLVKRLGNREGDSVFRIFHPSLRRIQNTVIREWMEEHFMEMDNMSTQSPLLHGNFRENMLNYDENVDVLKGKFVGKDLFIIAAGPSLDKNYLELREVRENGIILCTGAALHKLIQADIRPDYIIIIDAKDYTINQIRGMENLDIPILLLSSANKDIMIHYKGKKYIIYQNGFVQAEKEARKNNHMLFKTGGSVATTALDIGIQFECKRIIYLGLDLAFTDNKTHHSQTSSSISQKDAILVTDINGGVVGTSRNLNMYRRWMERRILEERTIEFIDATEGGAKVEGMKIMKMKDVLKG